MTDSPHNEAVDCCETDSEERLLSGARDNRCGGLSPHKVPVANSPIVFSFFLVAILSPHTMIAGKATNQISNAAFTAEKAPDPSQMLRCSQCDSGNK